MVTGPVVSGSVAHPRTVTHWPSVAMSSKEPRGLLASASRPVTFDLISPSRAYPYCPGQEVLPTSRWPKIVGSVTRAPAAYRDVPPPPDVRVTVPFGLTP